MHYVLDACSLIAFFNDEPGAQKILNLLEQAKNGTIRLSMSIVQLLEVYYDRLYISGEHGAQARVVSILAEPISIVETITYPTMYEAGRFKTSYSMSLADAIACATAKSLGATLVTKDEELKAPEQAGELTVLWLN